MTKSITAEHPATRRRVISCSNPWPAAVISAHKQAVEHAVDWHGRLSDLTSARIEGTFDLCEHLLNSRSLTDVLGAYASYSAGAWRDYRTAATQVLSGRSNGAEDPGPALEEKDVRPFDRAA